MVDTWEVSWTDATGKDQSREFAMFIDAWMFNEEILKGKGDVVLLTDRPTLTMSHARSEAEDARRREGGRRWTRKPRSEAAREER